MTKLQKESGCKVQLNIASGDKNRNDVLLKFILDLN